MKLISKLLCCCALALLAAGHARAANPGVNAATIHFAGTGTSNTTSSISVAGNLELVISLQAISGASYPTGISDTQGNTYTSLIGTLGNVNSILTNGAYKMSAFIAYTGLSSSNAVTVTYLSSSSSSIVYYLDLTNIAASSPLLSNIYSQQTAVANGTNVINVSSGTSSGTNNISAEPAIVITAITGSNGTISAGTSPIPLTIAFSSSNPTKVEYGVATSTYASFNSTASLSGGTTPTYYSWQLALLGNSATPPTGNASQFFLQ